MMTENTVVTTPDSAGKNLSYNNLKLLAAVLIGCIPLWLMSALIHLSDPDVTGIHEFASIGMLLSVTLWMGLLFLVPMIFIIGAQLTGKTKGYVISLIGVSIGISVFLALVSKGTLVFAELIVPSGVLLLVLGAASFPIVHALNRYY